MSIPSTGSWHAAWHCQAPVKRTHHGFGPRILLYSHDTYGLGHFRRSLAIANAVSERMPEASMLCVTGSPRSHAFPWPLNFDVVKLPSTTKDSHGRYVARSLDVSFDRLVELRSRILLETVRVFRPDLLLVDHAPVGMAGELRMALDAAKRELPSARIWLGLRDVMDSPRRAREEWMRERILPAVRDVYDQILIYGEREVFDPVVEYGWPGALAAKTTFVGYVQNAAPRISPHEVRRRLDLGKRRPIVTLMVGGGGDGDRLLRSYADAIDRRPHASHQSVMLTGPLLSERKRQALRARLAGHRHVRVVEFFEDVPALLRASEAVVTMGGYNSVVESLVSGKPAVLAPRRFPREEQAIRASRLARLGLVEDLGSDEPDPRALREAVERQLFGTASAAPRAALRFDGASAVVERMRDALTAGGLPAIGSAPQGVAP